MFREPDVLEPCGRNVGPQLGCAVGIDRNVITDKQAELPYGSSIRRVASDVVQVCPEGRCISSSKVLGDFATPYARAHA